MKQPLFSWKNAYLKVFFLGFSLAFLIFLPFLIYDHGMFLYYGDYNVQQIPFYRLAHDAVRSGEVFWNWNTDLGANFVGSYSFYLLGSPFFWLTIPFPSEALPYLMAPLLMLKFGISSVTSYGYISRFVRRRESAVFGALLYSFSGFAVYNVFFNHFNEVIALFPLLLIAMEELLVNRRKGVFALAVALMAVVNYYFFFGQVIFCILYFIVRSTSRDCPFRWKSFLLVAVESVIGLLCAGILLTPSILAVMSNSRLGETLTGFDLLLYNNVQRYGLILSSFFFPPDVPARPNFFPDSNSKWSSVSMFLPMISMTGIYAFFRAKKRHWMKSLLTVCFIICFIPGLNAAFSFLNYSYYARWFYMPLLLMAVVSCIAFEDHPERIRGGILFSGGFVLAFSLIGILPKKAGDALEWFSLPKYNDRFWAYVFLAVVGLLCTALLALLTNKSRYFYRCANISLCCIIVTYSCFLLFLGKTSGSNYHEIYDLALHGAESLELPSEEDGFYRIDTFDELDNLGMYWKIPTINAFQSVVPSSIVDYYEFIGSERGVASRPDPKFVGTRALLSVRYRMIRADRSGADQAPAGYRFHSRKSDYIIYENEAYIPMGFTYDAFVTEDLVCSVSLEYRDRVLLKGLLLEPEDWAEYSDLMPLLTNTDLSTVGDPQEWIEDAQDLARGNIVDSFAYDSRGFSASTDFDTDELVFFSVPYDSGWSATVNGEEARILKANRGFMAVYVPAGAGEIAFTYTTPGLSAGMWITLAGILLLAGYLLLIRRLEHRDFELRPAPHHHRCHAAYFPSLRMKQAYLQKRGRFPEDPQPPSEK